MQRKYVNQKPRFKSRLNKVSQYSVACIWTNSCFWPISCTEININTRTTSVTSMTSFLCFIANFEHISHLFSSVSIADFEQVNVSWVQISRYLQYLKIHLWISWYYKINHSIIFQISFICFQLTLALASETSASKWLFDKISANVTLKSKLIFNNIMLNAMIMWITTSFFKETKTVP